MSEPYISQIEIFAFGFAPKGWSICAGQLMSITQNQALFSLLGTIYGGDGRTTFALPDLRGSAAIGQGRGVGLTPHTMGEMSGRETYALLTPEIPMHNHSVAVKSNPDTTTNTYTPSGTVVLSQTTGLSGPDSIPFDIYAGGPLTQPMDPSAIGLSGNGQPHNNMMPYLTLNFCIAVQGVYPSRT